MLCMTKKSTFSEEEVKTLSDVYFSLDNLKYYDVKLIIHKYWYKLNIQYTLYEKAKKKKEDKDIFLICAYIDTQNYS